MSLRLEASSEIDLPPSTWADIVSAAESIAAQLFAQGELALQVVDSPAIRSLNRSYRGIDRPTDVLSFPAEAGSLSIGDIALCWDAVETQSVVNGNTCEHEAAALIAHAMLHLADWDHPDDDSQETMDKKTRELCLAAGFEVTQFGH